MTSDYLNEETTYKMVEANFDAEGVEGIQKLLRNTR